MPPPFCLAVFRQTALFRNVSSPLPLAIPPPLSATFSDTVLFVTVAIPSTEIPPPLSLVALFPDTMLLAMINDEATRAVNTAAVASGVIRHGAIVHDQRPIAEDATATMAFVSSVFRHGAVVQGERAVSADMDTACPRCRVSDDGHVVRASFPLVARHATALVAAVPRYGGVVHYRGPTANDAAPTIVRHDAIADGKPAIATNA